MRIERMFPSRACFCLLVIFFATPQSPAETIEGNAAIQFNVSNAEGNPVPCRIHLKDSEGKPKFAFGQPAWKDHFVCSGRVAATVGAGEYSWEIERGPEWERASGTVVVEKGKTATVDVALHRITSLNEEGWYSADMHVHRPVSEIKQLMLADDLNFAPAISWWNQPAPNAVAAEQTVFQFDENRIYCTETGEDEREGGALLFFGLSKRLDLSVKSREFPSPMQFVNQAELQNQDVWIDIEKPFWWDTPTWLATGSMDSIGIAHNHMHRSGVLGSEAWGKQRDSERLAGPHGNGMWTQEIYYHILESGIRIPPSAGSASGVLPNPVGYNRVYCYLGEEKFTRDNWFAALNAGRAFVTNGPLLRVKANSKWPGTVFRADGALSVDLDVTRTSNDPVSGLELIVNGKIAKRVRLSGGREAVAKFSFEMTEPGWFLVRSIADVADTFRFASTAPWYVEFPGKPRRVSRVSAQFFLDWVNERIERVNQNVEVAEQRDSINVWHLQAREFWLEKLENANAQLAENFTPDRHESLESAKERLLRILARISPDAAAIRRKVRAANTWFKLESALAPITLLSVSVNPESRVKVNALRDAVELRGNSRHQFIVRIENTAGITAPLSLVGYDLSQEEPATADWCELKVLDNSDTSRFLSGAEREFKIVEIHPKVAGLRELRVIGQAGQGTQDLGFRATTDLLLNIRDQANKSTP